MVWWDGQIEMWCDILIGDFMCAASSAVEGKVEHYLCSFSRSGLSYNLASQFLNQLLTNTEAEANPLGCYETLVGLHCIIIRCCKSKKLEKFINHLLLHTDSSVFYLSYDYSAMNAFCRA